MLSILKWLEMWNRSNRSNSSWDNIYGITICTLDNPGWLVKIELSETPLAGKDYENFSIDNGDNDWIVCRVTNGVFEGIGDPYKLEEILVIFRKWAMSFVEGE